MRQGAKRFIDINVCSDSMNNLLCAKCVREKIDAGEDDVFEEKIKLSDVHKVGQIPKPLIWQFMSDRLRMHAGINEDECAAHAPDMKNGPFFATDLM